MTVPDIGTGGSPELCSVTAEPPTHAAGPLACLLCSDLQHTIARVYANGGGNAEDVTGALKVRAGAERVALHW